jgi:hypothetical protein
LDEEHSLASGFFLVTLFLAVEEKVTGSKGFESKLAWMPVSKINWTPIIRIFIQVKLIKITSLQIINYMKR